MVMGENSGRRGWAAVLRVLIGVLFLAALVVGARSGVMLAMRQAPSSAASEDYPTGIRVRLERDSEDALLASESPKRIRDYFFLVDAGMIEKEPGRYDDLTRLSGNLDLELLDHDIDLVSVRVRSGSEGDEVLWVHSRQLPAPGALRAGKEVDQTPQSKGE
jgi:hypothetical protein